MVTDSNIQRNLIKFNTKLFVFFRSTIQPYKLDVEKHRTKCIKNYIVNGSFEWALAFLIVFCHTFDDSLDLECGRDNDDFFVFVCFYFSILLFNLYVCNLHISCFNILLYVFLPLWSAIWAGFFHIVFGKNISIAFKLNWLLVILQHHKMVRMGFWSFIIQNKVN